MSSIFKEVSVLNIVHVIYSQSKKLLSSLYCRMYRTFHTLVIVQVFYSMYYNLVALVIGRKKLEWKTHWQSPVCRDILRRKHYIAHWRTSLLWALFNFLLCALLMFDLRTKSLLYSFFSSSDVIWYIELSATLVVFLNACVASWLYAWVLVTNPMPLSPIQLQLFGINKSDPGFLVKDKPATPQSSKDDKLLFSPCHKSDRSLSITPLNYSANSWTSSPSGFLDSTSSSWSFHYPSPNIYMSTPKTNQKEGYIPGKNILSKSADESLLIRNNKQLERFLRQCEEDEKKMKSMSFEDGVSNITALDNSPLSLLSKSRYQRACRLPSMDPVENNSSETRFGDVLYRLRINEKKLDSWCEKLRKWISQTILVKLVAEIDEVNSSLCQMSLPEYQVGTVNLFALHQISVSKFQHLTSLYALLPYLDMHLNQEYLVQRLRDLAKGGCLSEFKWNTGGSYRDKAWCDDLPTDSAIILHVLCCYLDSYLPPEPHFPGGKPFSSKYFKKVPEKLAPAKDSCFIYQSSIVPPHFKVVIGQDIFSLPKGRNNLFHAFLIFLYHFKTKESCMLGRVNLGPSGLNLLWVIN